MTLYHGSKELFSSFETPTKTSVMDVTKGGVVYLTESESVARKYSQGGYIYTVEAGDSLVSYAEQRKRQGLGKKAKKYLRGVWVALPEDCKIVKVVKV